MTPREKTPKSARRRTSRNRRSLTRVVEKTFFTKSEASVRGVPAFIETDRFCRSSHHHHHSSSVESAPAHGRTHSRAMALVLRGARAAGVLKQVATAPLAQVRPRGSRGPRCRRHRRVRSRSRAQPVCSYDRVSVDARLTPRPTPTRTQANAARGFSVTTAGRAGMGSPVPAHEPPTGPVRTEVERRCAIEDIHHP